MTADATPDTRIAPIYRVSAVWFVLLFAMFFPVMIRQGLRSPIFWAVFVGLWACAALHGRLTPEQTVELRRGLRPVAWGCVLVWGVVFMGSTIAWFAVQSTHFVSTAAEQLCFNHAVASFLAGFCSVCALVSSYEQNPS